MCPLPERAIVVFVASKPRKRMEGGRADEPLHADRSLTDKGRKGWCGRFALSGYYMRPVSSYDHDQTRAIEERTREEHERYFITAHLDGVRAGDYLGGDVGGRGLC
jgi:hypothetical protein